jgi:hypothetical protein
MSIWIKELITIAQGMTDVVPRPFEQGQIYIERVFFEYEAQLPSIAAASTGAA